MPGRERLPLLLLIALWAALYLPHLLAGQTLPARDLAATYMPWRQVWRSEIRAGVWPLWDVATNHGRPLWANPDQAAAYPGTLLFAALTPEHATAWHVALHHLILLCGCFVLARRSGAGPGAAAIGAAAAGTSGVAFSTAVFLPHVAALAWSPWALSTAVGRPASPRKAASQSVAGGCLLGVIFLTGEPVTAGLMSLAWLALVLFAWPRRTWWGIATAALAAFACAAPLFIPLIATFPDTVRGALGVAERALSSDSLAPRRWIELAFPHVLGQALGDGHTGFWAAPSFPWQRYYPTIFLGSAALLTLPFARRTGRDERPWWLLFAVGTVGASLVAIGPVELAVQQLPLVRSVQHGIKFLVLSTVASAPLVAAGWERLREVRPRTSRVWAGVLVVCAAVASALTLAPTRTLRPALRTLYPASQGTLASTPDRELRRGVLVDALALALPPAALLVARPLPFVMVAAAFASNTLAGNDVLTWDDAARWAQPPRVASGLLSAPTVAVFVTQAQPDSRPGSEVLRRFWDPRAALVPNYGTRWGISYVLDEGPNGVEPVRHGLLVAATANLSLTQRARVAAALGARAVVSDAAIPGWTSREVDGVFVSSTDGYSPPAYLAQRVLSGPTLDRIARIMSDEGFRPGCDAAVEGAPRVQHLKGGSAEELEGVPHSRAFEVTNDGPGLLVVQQSFMTCWNAGIDGKPAPAGPVNGASTGIFVPPGRHRVTLFLDPMPYRIGLACPVALLGVVVATRVFLRRRDDRRGLVARGRPAAESDR